MNVVTGISFVNGMKRVHYLVDLLPESAIEAMPVATVPISGPVIFGARQVSGFFTLLEITLDALLL
jgi:hypothetical protein